MNLPRKVCYREGLTGVSLNDTKEVLYLDKEHFDRWAAAPTDKKEALLKVWLLTGKQQDAK